MSLNANYTFVGKGNWSLDAVGGEATSGGVVSAIVPDGSRIEAAFLYASTFGSGAITSVNIARGAENLSVTDFDPLGLSGPLNLQGFRADITSYVRGVIGDGDAATLDFNISSIVGLSVDGVALVVVYSNPDEDTRTISLLDGFSNPDGDAFELTFTEPVDTDQDGFEAQMSLGIGFGFQGADQFSTITVDGRQLTTSAGGSDDGVDQNGGLVTIGGIEDSADNPDPDALPANNRRTDDELYDLAKGNSANTAPFLADGATSISVTTLNPSDDDNIFFAGFNITAVVAVDTSENDAPVAVGDEVSVDEDDTVSFGVLGNDFDPDEGDTISFSSVDDSGLEGTLTSNGDGTFTYDPNDAFDDLDEGETATETFTYTITDGELTGSATVTITINGEDDDVDPPGGCPTVDRPGTQDGSAAANETLTGPDYHNTFFFDNAAGSTGDDRISNFAKDDVLVVTELLADSNNDGIIGFGRNGVLDLGGGDTVRFDGGVRSLRYLGEACEGNFVYADATVRPMGAQEGFVLTDDAETGDAGDTRADIFFFDTALDLDLGDDTIANFGARDILVTTTSLFDSNTNEVVTFGPNALLDFSGGLGGPGDPGVPGEGGSVGITGLSGVAVTRLEYDGSIERNGVTYYVYSAVGSAADVTTLGFGAPAAAASMLNPGLPLL